MSARIVPAAQFKAECLRLIDEMNESGEPVTITRRGKPVAVLSPIQSSPARTLIGASRGVVTRYDEPFEPAADAGDWAAMS